jgi:two-component system, sporulation sensor kinase E
VKRQLPTLKGDAYRLQQVFLNLMTNAILYNDKTEGWIEIDFLDEPHQYTFSIRDNGKGIYEKDVKRIFKMFESLNPNDRSTGIGLTIVKKILDDMHEKIYLESEPGVGSVFYFTLNKYGTRAT